MSGRRVVAIRGALSVAEDTAAAIGEATSELLCELLDRVGVERVDGILFDLGGHMLDQIVWLLGRIYSTGTPEDYRAVNAIQDRFKLVPLSAD
mgnify:CR=1 FL=1